MTDASIIIANRNYDRFLRDSIDSALSQTHPVEVVVVDDGSEDPSRNTIASYGERIVPILIPWSGQAAAINAGIEAATGSVLFFLDSDDVADPNRVADVMALFAADSTLLWVRHNLRAIDQYGRVVVDDLYRRGQAGRAERDILTEGKTTGTTSGLVVRTAFFDDLGPIPNHYRTYPDSYILIRGALTGHGTSLAATLGGHRWHRGSFTAYGWHQWDRAEFHLLLRKHLADDAGDIAARLNGPRPLATRSTWWQLKATAEWRKAQPNHRGWVRPYIGYLRAIGGVRLSPRKRLALAARAIVLMLIPQPLFRQAWWVTHVGRPGILRPTLREQVQ